MPDIHNYNGYIIRNLEKLPTNPPIHIYINKINNRLLFKTKDGYKLELKTIEIMKLFGSTKKIIKKLNVPSLAVVEVVLEQCNLVDSQFQQKSETVYAFAPSKSYAYLLNVETSNLLFLKTYNPELYYRSKW